MSISSHRPTILTDVETIPAEGMVLEETKNSFPVSIYHKLIAASFSVLNPTPKGYDFQQLITISGSEPKILSAYSRIHERTQPWWVTYNGHSFDFNVINIRSFVNGIPQKGWYQPGTKWASYPNRFADWHTDLCDVMSGYGATKKLKLDVVAASIGLPGKSLGMDGSKVADYYAAGRLAEIRNYCEADTLNTAGVYLRWQLITGEINLAQYAYSIEQFLCFLEREGQKDDARHLHKFRDLIDLTKFAVEEPPTTQSLVRKAVTHG